jgi:para-aminobenzoate synthetase / 4-amino-4-deoxychorismate lyase
MQEISILKQAARRASKLADFHHHHVIVDSTSSLTLNVSSLPNPQACFVLLDDALSATPNSQLFTDLREVLICTDAGEWDGMFARTQQALCTGRYAVAMLSYETGAQLHGIALNQVGETASQTGLMPSQVLIFDQRHSLNSEQVKAWLAQHSQSHNAYSNRAAPAGIAGLQNNIDAVEFDTAIEKIHALIAAGDTYQVNFTYRLKFDVFGSALALYARLRERQPVPYGALIQLPDGQAILSFSPELFVQHRAGRLTTRPMKGTAAASGDAQEDQRRAEQLAADAKNRAENLMIVDLLRNDLGRIAVTGSVQVPALFSVQRFSSVLQMTSTIEAQLRPELTLGQIMRVLFPCGSITGAPKHRTMQIIQTLESAPRGIYTGALGWFAPPESTQEVGDFCLSVPIRTLQLAAPEDASLLTKRTGVMGVGAGIVFDSVAEEEYAECQLKARFLTSLEAPFYLFETMRATNFGCQHRVQHLARLQGSAQYFGFRVDLNAVQEALDKFCAKLAANTQSRLRLTLYPNGEFDLQSAELKPLSTPVKVLISETPCRTEPLLLAHKISYREQYDAGWQTAEQQGAFDMLFFNSNGFLTEGGRSNVFLRQGEKWYTPPLSDGVLPGVMRALVLNDARYRATEKKLRLEDLRTANEIILCNSLRGVMSAELLRKGEG